jgi:hypothetical protein
MAHRPAKGLNDKNIFFSHVFLDLDKQIVIGKPRNIQFAEGDIELSADFLCKAPV